jgi:hypothetical protein
MVRFTIASAEERTTMPAYVIAHLQDAAPHAEIAD